MANIKSFPNNQDVYTGAEYVMKWLHGRTSGVFGAGDNAAVSALTTPGMAVTVSDGNGWMANGKGDGIVWWNDSEEVNTSKLQIAIDAADGVLNRIDRVIVEWKTTNYVDYPEIKVLKGAMSSNPYAPSLTNNSTVRQISLARISVSAGTTAITASMITDERLDPAVCGIVTDWVQVDTSMIQNQVSGFLGETQNEVSSVLKETQSKTSALLKSIEDELASLEAGTAVELKKLLFTNVAVPVSDFVADTTYQDYGFRASVALEGVISSMIPEAIFGVEDATSGNFAPVVDTYDGGVYIYSASKPESEVTVPTIIFWRGA